jgi:response regulator of citrate/malate metabolism
VTFAVLHRVAAKRLAKGLKDPHMTALFETIAEATKFTVEREAARKSTITRQTRRRVIRLPDRSAKS